LAGVDTLGMRDKETGVGSGEVIALFTKSTKSSKKKK
jgi:hypothetical protein